ncbi:hypothetical protein EMPS_09630 [Entomortierella parvispora]|uniref:Uncharacterized protein n=1 Tax=Entomortierella parvispora TaxID=205924 RepID=A0A9P3HIJ6_9FUNG|nr:hypothetical protein EMPS_09630 [Entomortierella parvispora]
MTLDFSIRRHPLAIQELCDHIALYLDFPACRSLCQVSRACHLGFLSHFWQLSNLGRKDTSLSLLRGLAKHGHNVRSINVLQWTGRELLLFHLRKHCHFLSSIEILDKSSLSNSTLTRQLFFEGELDVDEELEEMDYADRVLWKKAGSPLRNPDLDVSNLRRLRLTLSHHDAEQFLLYATRSARNFIAKDTLSTQEDEKAEMGCRLSLQHAWAPQLQEFTLEAAIPYSRYPRKSRLALPDLLVAFPNCRSWAFDGVYVTELNPAWSERSLEEQREIENRKINRLKYMSIKEKSSQQEVRPNIHLQDAEGVYGRTLQTLSIEGNIQITSLEWLLTHSPRVQNLTLSYVLENMETARAVLIFEALTLSCKELRALQLTKPLYMGDGGYDALDAMFVSLRKLETLTLPSWLIHNEVFDSLVSRHGNIEFEENEMTGAEERPRRQQGLVHASFTQCSINDMSGIRRWLASQASWRLVVLDLSGTILSVNLFAPLSTNISVGVNVPADPTGTENMELVWGCDNTLEVLKIDRIRFLSSHLYDDEGLDAVLADARRVRQRLERLVRLKTLVIGRANVPQSIFLPQDNTSPVNSASPPDSSDCLLVEQTEPRQPMLFNHLTSLRLEGLYPKLGPSEIDRLLSLYPSLTNLQAYDSFTQEGLEHFMRICKNE